MKIKGIENLYQECFENNVIELCNVEESCNRFFHSRQFQKIIDNKIMSTSLNYDEENDIMRTEVVCFVDIPLLSRIEKVLCDYYRKIKYVAIYKNAKLVDEEVEILK